MEIYSTEEQQVDAIKQFWKDYGTSIVVGAVVGLEYRIDEIDSQPDNVAADGLFFGFFADGGAEGDKDTTEVFGEIELPRASMRLAQAAGRLIRSRTDRGAVAVLDKRLGTARYRWDIVNALPPMRRTRHRADAEDFLRRITA